MSKTVKRLDLLFREVQDLAAQENFYRIKAYIDNLAATGLVGPQGPQGPALVIGDNFEQFSDLTTFTTTSDADQVAATFTTASKQVGLYRVGLCFDWTISATTSDAIFSLYIDGVLQDGEWGMETSETVTQNIPFNWFTYINFGTVATHTIELRARSETAGVTTTVNRVRVEMWRVS